MVEVKVYLKHFDEPLRYGVPLPEKRQVDIAVDGLRTLLDLLNGLDVKATFCITQKFIETLSELKARLEDDGHKIVVVSAMPHRNCWLSLHILPFDVVAYLARRKGELIVEAWEFSQRVAYNRELRLPYSMRRNCGVKMCNLFAMTIDKLKK